MVYTPAALSAWSTAAKTSLPAPNRSSAATRTASAAISTFVRGGISSVMALKKTLSISWRRFPAHARHGQAGGRVGAPFDREIERVAQDCGVPMDAVIEDGAE